MACIFHSISSNYEQRMLGYILGSRVFMDIPDVVNCAAYCVQKRGATADCVVLSCQRCDVTDVYAVVDHLACVVK